MNNESKAIGDFWMSSGKIIVQMFTGATFWKICINFTHQNLHLRVYYQVLRLSKLEREGLKDDFVQFKICCYHSR